MVAKLRIEFVRKHLELELPEYMVPSSFTILDSIPLTINGKIDYKSLPDPDFTALDTYVEPRNELEKQLCQIWGELLQIENVGIEDNFFRIGGDSIKSIQLVSKLRKFVEKSISPKDIFDYPTISKLFKRIIELDESESKVHAEQGVLDGEFPLLPIQEWFYAKKELNYPNHFNQAFSIKIPNTITKSMVDKALITLMNHHDILRCQFNKSTRTQKYFTSIKYIECIEIDEMNNDLLTKLQSDFDLENGPLWKCALINKSHLWFAFHHMIIDAVSWRIIAEDMSVLLTDPDSFSTMKTSSYRQWVNVIDSYRFDNSYWENVMKDYEPLNCDGSNSSSIIEFSKSITDKLLHEANKSFNTEINDLLLSGLGLALSKFTNKQTNHISLEGIGRVDGIDDTIDLTRTVGWFTSIYPVKLESNHNLEETIIKTKEMLRNIPDKGIGFGALSKTKQSFSDLPKIVFNYLGQFSSSSKTGDNFWEIETDVTLGKQVLDDDSGNLLDLNGLVDKNGQLMFHCDGKVDGFANTFKESLIEIVEFCCNQKETCLTPSDFDAKLLTISQLNNLKSQYRDIEAIYPATSLQQGFIYHALSKPDDDAYRVQLLLDYNNLDINKYLEAWKLASIKHPVLRTCFSWESEMFQIVLNKESSFEYSIIDIENENEIDEYQVKDRFIPFDLRKSGLIRFTFCKRSKNDIVTIIVNIHHSIVDGWSLPILFETVQSFYKHIPASVLVDKQYFECQKYLTKHNAKEYWNNIEFEHANDINMLLSNPIDLSNVPVITKPYEKQISIDSFKLKETCSRLGITMNVLVQFAWHYILHTYTGDDQTIVGTTVSGRDIPIDGADTCVGLFINTLPLWIDWNDTKSIDDILHLIQRRVSELNSNSNISLAQLQTNGVRLFHSIVVFENYPMDESTSEKDDMKFRKAVEKLDYPIGLIAYESAKGLELLLKSSSDWLSENRCLQLLEQMKLVLEQLIMKKETISLLSEHDVLLLEEWNSTEVDFPKNKTLHGLFEEQVEKTPNNIALVFENEELTYSELNKRANYLANKIGKLKPDTLVGLYLDRSLEMVISILAILKAGGAYVPISPEYPQDRVDL